MINIRRTLISCWDKTGLENLCRGLKHFDVEIISSGGTAEYLRRNEIPVTTVEQITDFQEVMDGRVKTLHPIIHAGILATQGEAHRKDLEKIGAQPIQLVVVNFYPFVEKAVEENLALEEAIEFIDIGGPAMLRAAAKNFQNVVGLDHPSQYENFNKLLNLHNGQIPLDYSRERAEEIFFNTARYDGKIQDYFQLKSSEHKKLPQHRSIFLQKKEELRYGENPHQLGAFYQQEIQSSTGLAAMEQLWGKQLSFNNYMDVNAAYELVLEFSDPAAAIIKHMNPCGAAISLSGQSITAQGSTDRLVERIGNGGLAEAFQKARAGDPISAFGGIVALNRTVNSQTARDISETFFECVIAPDFESAALEILKKKKNLRILKLNPDKCKEGKAAAEIKSVNGAYLLQEKDKIEEDPQNWKVVSKKQPSRSMISDLTFMWKVCKHVKSNAIVIGKNQEVYGIGAGQMSRVDSVEISILKAKRADRQLKDTVLASDAFFPFRDGIDLAAESGVAAIIQPGGSIRDEEVIQAANEHEMVMLFTGIRHFRH